MYVSGTRSEIIVGFLATFLSLMMIGSGVTPEQITRAEGEHWLSLTTELCDRPMEKTSGCGIFGFSGNLTTNGFCAMKWGVAGGMHIVAVLVRTVPQGCSGLCLKEGDNVLSQGIASTLIKTI